MNFRIGGFLEENKRDLTQKLQIDKRHANEDVRDRVRSADGKDCPLVRFIVR